MNGIKYDKGKARWDLLPIHIIEKVVNVLTFGAKKYGENNWQKIPKGIDRYYAATMRHINSWRKKEKIDLESGEHHLIHAITCLIFIIYIENKRELKNKLRRKKCLYIK